MISPPRWGSTQRLFEHGYDWCTQDTREWVPMALHRTGSKRGNPTAHGTGTIRRRHAHPKSTNRHEASRRQRPGLRARPLRCDPRGSMRAGALVRLAAGRPRCQRDPPAAPRRWLLRDSRFGRRILGEAAHRGRSALRQTIHSVRRSERRAAPSLRRTANDIDPGQRSPTSDHQGRRPRVAQERQAPS